jgi:hypothetical protein
MAYKLSSQQRRRQLDSSHRSTGELFFFPANAMLNARALFKTSKDVAWQLRRLSNAPNHASPPPLV